MHHWKLNASLLHDIILDARINCNKTFSQLMQGYGSNVSDKEEKLKEIIYDARQDREYDYITAADQKGLISTAIIVGELQHFDGKYDRKSFISYDGKDTVLLGFKGKKTLEAGYVYAPYIPMRGVFPKIVAEDIVSVQPMSEPCGLAFETDYVPEVNIELESEKIVCKPRKLKCKWSMEQMADLSTYHSINNKTVLEGLANDIRMEIDKEIIESLKASADKSHTFAGFMSNAAANNMHSSYSEKSINKNYYKKLVFDKPIPVVDIALETVTLKKNNMLNKSMSEGMDEAIDDFLDEKMRENEVFAMPKIDPVEIPF